ncbi:hypothetical protein [Bosea sp. BIWAKO-01]|uniref:hypothetical protein n=1 Tax=Bosea sp. BIWAKO-01 TaxID=506668 RepID=UPI0008538CEB|nr:hypothetical protein [Bosea sp. BIWAKO-01]GAU87042.1 hypothetical protein BIWAKO_06995 [Bosea sp. BIWAKO-01]
MDRASDDQEAFINTLAASLAGAVTVGRNALVEIAILSGPERLDALEQQFLNDAKNASIEGVSIEEDVRLLNNIMTTVRMIFAQAREAVADRLDNQPRRGGDPNPSGGG